MSLLFASSVLEGEVLMPSGLASSSLNRGEEVCGTLEFRARSSHRDGRESIELSICRVACIEVRIDRGTSSGLLTKEVKGTPRKVTVKLEIGSCKWV